MLPFVFLYERKDFVVKLYGANIFPDTIRHALQQRIFERFLTSKFTLAVKYNQSQNQYLEVNLELKKGEKGTDILEKKIQKEIINNLLRENSEFVSNYRSLRERQIPKIVLWPYEHPDLFKPGGKQNWVKK